MNPLLCVNTLLHDKTDPSLSAVQSMSGQQQACWRLDGLLQTLCGGRQRHEMVWGDIAVTGDESVTQQRITQLTGLAMPLHPHAPKHIFACASCTVHGEELLCKGDKWFARRM